MTFTECLYQRQGSVLYPEHYTTYKTGRPELQPGINTTDTYGHI